MICGLLGKWERLRYELSASATFSDDGGGSASLVVTHAPNLTQAAETVRIQIEPSRGLLGNLTYVYVEIGGVPYSQTLNGQLSASVTVEFINPRWYIEPGDFGLQYRAAYDSCEVRVNGSLVLTLLNGAFGSLYLAPAGLPLAYCYISASVSATITDETNWGDVGNPCDCISGQADATATLTVNGGWKVKENGSWRSFPVRYTHPAVPSTPCGITPPSLPVVNIPNTGNASITVSDYLQVAVSDCYTVECWECTNGTANAPAIFCVRDVYNWGSNQSATVWLLPDWEREFVKLNNLYKGMWYRYKLPYAKVVAQSTAGWLRLACGNDDGCMDTNTNELEIAPFRDQILSVVGNATHPIEDALQDRPVTPFSITATRSYSHTRPSRNIAPGACPNFIPGEDPPDFIFCACARAGTPLGFQSYSENAGIMINSPVGSPVGVPPDQMLSYYAHEGDPLSPIFRYINTLFHPFWSYFLWFEDWELGVPLQPAPKLDYWIPFQQQYLYNPALPPSEQLRYRSVNVLEPLNDSPLRGFVKSTLIPLPTLWVGITRPERFTPTIPTSRALDQNSAPRWSATNATLVFGANIIITPTATSCTVEFDLTSWNVPPYLYPAFADAVRISLTGLYTSLTVALVNLEGETITLQPESGDPTLYKYVREGDTVYAGSWAQSYSANLEDYIEIGNDLQPNGRSAVAMGDTARRTLFELMGNKAPAKLRLTITQVAPAPLTLSYPIFYRYNADWKAYPETAHIQTLIAGDTLVRHGALEFQLTDPNPLPRATHSPPTLYDAFCLVNTLFRGEPYQADMLSWAGTLFDDEEWTGQFADLRMETRAVYSLYEQQPNRLDLLCINAWRELPPLITLPTQHLFEPARGYGQWRYTIADPRRYYLAQNEPAHLYEVQFDAGGNENSRQQWTLSLETFNNTHVSYLLRPLTNQEVIYDGNGALINSPRYYIVSDDDLARTTPFHSHSLVLPITVQEPGKHHAVLEADSLHGWLHLGIPQRVKAYHIDSFELWMNQPIKGVPVSITHDTRLARLLMAVSTDEETGAHQLWRSSYGQEWEVVLSMTANKVVVEALSQLGVWVAIAQLLSGETMRYESLDGGASWSAAERVKLDGTDASVKPHALTYDARLNALVMAYSTDPNTYHLAVSTDCGKSFTTVL
jgi:hypothetical protein